MTSMIIHDSRLIGGTPNWYRFVMSVGPRKGIRSIVETVARSARETTGLRKLHILCHGFEANWNVGRNMCVQTAHGGFGIQLGTEGLSLNNYGVAAPWKGLVREIVLFACAPADTGAGNTGTWGDGKRFCGYLATVTGATVIAARDTQYYQPTGVNGRIDFGAWEGPVFAFSDANPEGERIRDPSRYRVHNTRAAAG
jgi:hypothetical protein